MFSNPANRRSRLPNLLARTALASTLLVVVAATRAEAQTRVVSACSGVSLPPSVVTGIVAPAITTIAGRTENTVNGIINDPLLGLGPLVPPLDTDATGLLAQAAAGQPITLQAIDTSGNVVGPTDQCRATSDSIQLNTPAGIAIGGNSITGLGGGTAPFAGDIDSVALGNNARVETGATGSLALGPNASATAANSVALGAGSAATRGAQTGYTAPLLAGVQNSAGEVSVGTPTALRQITNVAAGSAPTDAATVGQVTGAVDGLNAQITANTTAIGTLNANAVQYDDASRARATLGGTGGTTIANVAAGQVSATSSEAVNGAQLYATNAQVAANTAAIAGLGSGTGGGNTSPVRYADAATPTTPNGGTVTDQATLTGASGGAVGLHNVAAGTVAAGSTDAVNGGQLAATNQSVATLGTQVAGNTSAITALGTQVAGNTTAITNLQTGLADTNSTVASLSTQVAGNTSAITNLGTQVSSNTTAITNLSTQVANQPLRYSNAATPTTANGGTVTNDATLAGANGGAVGLHNVAAGAVAVGSTDAVNGGQLAATNAQVATNTAAIGTINTTLAGASLGAVQYANAATPTTANGGTRTNDLTLTGANSAAPVGLHNVAAGTVAAGSTDAVNGGQLAAVATTASNSLQYDSTATGARANRVTLVGGNTTAGVTITNLAAGTVSATSTDAVNGAELYATSQVAQRAATLGANSVQYDTGGTSVTFGTGTGATPVTLHNVGAGTSATDAANVGQLQSGMQATLSQSYAYTDSRFTALAFDLRDVRRELSAGTSAAMAMAALPQATDTHGVMVAVGGGTYRGQYAFAFGASKAFDDGRTVVKLGGTYDSQGYGGANGSIGFHL